MNYGTVVYSHLPNAKKLMQVCTQHQRDNEDEKSTGSPLYFLVHFLESYKDLESILDIDNNLNYANTHIHAHANFITIHKDL